MEASKRLELRYVTWTWKEDVVFTKKRVEKRDLAKGTT
jgi:hypothetical protein